MIFFHEILLKQIAKWLSYILDSFTSFIFEVLNQRWTIGENLVDHYVAPVKKSQGVKSQDSVG